MISFFAWLALGQRLHAGVLTRSEVVPHALYHLTPAVILGGRQGKYYYAHFVNRTIEVQNSQRLSSCHKTVE